MFNFFSRLGKRKIIGLVILVVCLIALPLILLQVGEQQTLRQRAAGAEFLNLGFDPPTKTVKKDEIFNVSLIVNNPKQKDVSGIDVVINYDSDVLSLNSLQPREDSLTTIINDTSVPSKIHYVGVNSNPSLHFQDSFYIVTISFRAKAPGVGIVRFSDAVVTAQGESSPLEIFEINNLGRFTVTEPTPTPPITLISPSSCEDTDANTPDPFAVPGEVYSINHRGEKYLFYKDFCPNNTYVLEGICFVDTGPNVIKKDCDCKDGACIDYPSPTTTPNLPKIQLTFNKQVAFGGDTIIASVKTDPNVDGIFLFSGTFDEIPTEPPSTRFSKNCDPNVECLLYYAIRIPEGAKNFKVIATVHTPKNGWVTSETKAIQIRHFSASVSPSQTSPPGTFFTINAQTNASQVKAVINGPGFNNYTIALYNDGLHGDGSLGDEVYGYTFPTSGSQGTYVIRFMLDDQETPVIISFVTQYSTDACMPFFNSGPTKNKINIVIIPNNYSESELSQFQSEVLPRHMNFLFSKEPYSSNKDKFNVWFIRKAYSVDCAHEKEGSCFSEMEKNLVSICPFVDKAILLDKNGGGGYAPIGGKVAVVLDASHPRSQGATMHEFGHAFGRLADEYDGLSWHLRSDTSEANCDVYACPKWCSGKSSYEEPQCSKITAEQKCKDKSYNGVKCVWFGAQNKCDYPYYSTNINFGQACIENTVCLYGCGGSNGYRSSNYSIMGDTNNNKVMEYNTVSGIQLQKMIDLLWKQKNK